MRLEIQHCVNITAEPGISSYLKFAIAPISKPGLPYHFSLVDRGEFNEMNWYGSINRREFCLVSIVGIKSNGGEEGEEEQKQKGEENGGVHFEEKGWQQQQERMGSNYDEERVNNEEHKEKKMEPLEPQKDVKELQKTLTTGVSAQSVTYIGMLYYEANDEDNDEVTFTTAKKLNALIEPIKKYYAKAKMRQNINYRFGDSSDCIELILDDTQQTYPFTGWTIQSRVKPCRLYKEDIDQFGARDPFPPNLVILVHGSPSSTTVPMLYYDVPLKGVHRPVTLCIDGSLRNIPSDNWSTSKIVFVVVIILLGLMLSASLGYLAFHFKSVIGIYGLVLLGGIFLILSGYFVFIWDSTLVTVFYGLVLGLTVSSLAEYFSIWAR
ncbi:PREDICTED: uncharacterized protein LOC109591440, partial [Amphimedon queenslandica]|uniref:Transmembrane protein n=1 Tax=Amphimedon queenslandica TaxID=400682 RepID=A0AAN0K0P0_AMPQE